MDIRYTDLINIKHCNKGKFLGWHGKGPDVPLTFHIPNQTSFILNVVKQSLLHLK